MRDETPSKSELIKYYQLRDEEVVSNICIEKWIILPWEVKHASKTISIKVKCGNIESYQ